VKHITINKLKAVKSFYKIMKLANYHKHLKKHIKITVATGKINSNNPKSKIVYIF